MRRHLWHTICIALVLTAAAPSLAAPCAPAKLVHIRFTDVTPGIDPDSFAAKPKDLYRIGSGKMRVEEAVDAVNGIHGITVSNEPDIWMANLYDHTGKHVVDPGPTYFARAPVFGTILPGKLMDLEFGCEADFIADNALKPARTEQIDGVAYDVYRLEGGSDAIEILRRPGIDAPSFARYYRQGVLQIAIRYDLYQTGLADDPALFAPPPHVDYAEVSQH